MRLDELLIRLRTERDLTQRQMAQEAQIDGSLISRIEAGKGKPTAKTAIKIFNILQKHRPLSPNEAESFCELVGIPRGARAMLLQRAAEEYNPAEAQKANMLDCYDAVNILIAERGTQRVLRFLLAVRDIIQE